MIKLQVKSPHRRQRPSPLFSPPVLVQFLLDAFLSSSSAIRRVQELIPELVQPTAPTLPRKKGLSADHKVSEQINLLLTPTDNQLLEHPWTPLAGSLSKLRAYTALFAILWKSSEPIQKLNEEVEKAWRAAAIAPKPISHLDLIKLSHSLKRVERRVLPLLDVFLHDANLIYFLLRHYQRFDDCYGRGFTRRLFKKWHPQGTAGIRLFLVKSYKERGFHHLIDNIKNLMTEIERTAS